MFVNSYENRIEQFSSKNSYIYPLQGGDE